MARAGGVAAHHLQQRRAHEGQEGDHHRHRVARQAEQHGAACAGRIAGRGIRPTAMGRPGRIATRQNAMSPSCCITARVWSASPTLTPPLVMMASACAGGSVQRGFERGRVVAHQAEVDHLAAQAREQAEHRVAVAVVDRAFARRLAQAQDLVAGGEVGDAQAAQHRHRRQARGWRPGRARRA